MRMRESLKGVFLFFAVGVFLHLSAIPGESNKLPIVTKTCNTLDLGATYPTGLAYDDLDGTFVVTDYYSMVYTYDNDCNSVSSFDATVLGVPYPQGITVNDSGVGAHKLAMVDFYGDVVFSDTSGGYLGGCDGAAIGATAPRGITYNSSTGNYALVDSTSDKVYIIDETVMDGSPCNVTNEFFTFTFGSDNPQGITYLSDTDQYAVTDMTDRIVYIISTSGALQDQFEISYGVGAANAQGITYNAGQERYFISDYGTDLVYETDARGTSNFLCDTAILSATNPTDVTFNANTNEIAFVDNTTDRVLILDLSCNFIRPIDILALGLNNPTGMVYLPDTNQLAITDATDDGIYFIGYDSEIVESQCDTGSLGILNPSGIAYVPYTNQLAVTDSYNQSLFLLDRTTCQVVTQRTLGAMNAGLWPATSGVSFHQGDGTFLTVDYSADDVVISNFEGSLMERKIDTYGLGLGSIQGITPLLSSGTSFLVVDNTADAIYRWDIPLLVDGPSFSISGLFTSGGFGGSMQIFERGGGHFNGTYIYGTLTAPIYGYYNSATGEITMGAIHPNDGSDLSWQGTVDADLNTIRIGAPLGDLTRTY